MTWKQKPSLQQHPLVWLALGAVVGALVATAGSGVSLQGRRKTRGRFPALTAMQQRCRDLPRA